MFPKYANLRWMNSSCNSTLKAERSSCFIPRRFGGLIKSDMEGGKGVLEDEAVEDAVFIVVDLRE
jgi:hypothetical protein